MAYCDFISLLHTSTKRDYLARVTQRDKAEVAELAIKYDYDYWDGSRETGYGGYRYDGRWRKVADAIVKLIGKWDDGLYKKHLAHAFPKRDKVVEFYDGVRKAHGTCAVKSAEHAAFDRTIVLACERGRDIRMSLTLDAKDRSVIRSYTLRPIAVGGTCPVR